MPRTNYQLRFSTSELAAYQALADKANLSLAVWARDRLNLAVSLAAQNLLLCGHSAYRNGHCAEMSCLNYINKTTDIFGKEQPTESHYSPFLSRPGEFYLTRERIDDRELSSAELSCPVRGCSLGSSHSGPCMPRVGDPETLEIREQNLIVLSRDDPEGFKSRVRELLALERKG